MLLTVLADVLVQKVSLERILASKALLALLAFERLVPVVRLLVPGEVVRACKGHAAVRFGADVNARELSGGLSIAVGCW